MAISIDNAAIIRLSWIIGLLGLLAAVLTGSGEFLLHFDPQARFTDGLAFFEGISEQRSNIGHFLSVMGAPGIGKYLMPIGLGDSQAEIAKVR